MFPSLDNIPERNPNNKCGPFIHRTLYLDRTAMCYYSTSGNGKTKTGSSDFSGVGFIHPVETFKNIVNGFLRNTDTGITDLYIEKLVVCIQ